MSAGIDDCQFDFSGRRTLTSVSEALWVWCVPLSRCPASIEPALSTRLQSYRAAADLGIAQAKCIDDPVYYLYLCLVADWRTDWQEAETHFEKSHSLSETEVKLYRSAFALRDEETGQARELIDQTIAYRNTGQLPPCATCVLPELVVSQTLADREANKHPKGGGTAR